MPVTERFTEVEKECREIVAPLLEMVESFSVVLNVEWRRNFSSKVL
jgi:hypothetical protein